MNPLVQPLKPFSFYILIMVMFSGISSQILLGEFNADTDLKVMPEFVVGKQTSMHIVDVVVEEPGRSVKFFGFIVAGKDNNNEHKYVSFASNYSGDMRSGTFRVGPSQVHLSGYTSAGEIFSRWEISSGHYSSRFSSENTAPLCISLAQSRLSRFLVPSGDGEAWLKIRVPVTITDKSGNTEDVELETDVYHLRFEDGVVSYLNSTGLTKPRIYFEAQEP